jgi:hypothetical protein
MTAINGDFGIGGQRPNLRNGVFWHGSLLEPKSRIRLDPTQCWGKVSAPLHLAGSLGI